MAVQTVRYEFDPRPFWRVVNTVEDVFADELPGYRVETDSKDEAVLTGDTDEAYSIRACEHDTYNAWRDGIFRYPHKIRFGVPREREVDTVTVDHGMPRSELYEYLVDDKSDVVDEVMTEFNDRLDG